MRDNTVSTPDVQGPSPIPSSLLLFLSEKDDVSMRTEATVCRLTVTCAADAARVRISGPPRLL